jgi:hypothetical protein
MLGLARTPEHRLGVLVRPALQLGEGNEPELPAPDQPQLGLNVPLERVQHMPSDIAASWRLRATRGTLLDAVLTATSI